jgi:hypothetical protein
MPGGRQFGADNPWDRKDDPVEKTPLPIEQIALRLDESGLTPAQQLELGLTLDQAKVLFVASGTDAFSLAATIDAAGLTHILIRDDDGRLGSILDIEWAKSQARNFLEAPQIQSFQEFAELVSQAGEPSGSSWYEHINSTRFNRPSLVVCHKQGHHNHLAPSDPCGLP